MQLGHATPCSTQQQHRIIARQHAHATWHGGAVAQARQQAPGRQLLSVLPRFRRSRPIGHARGRARWTDDGRILSPAGSKSFCITSSPALTEGPRWAGVSFWFCVRLRVVEGSGGGCGGRQGVRFDRAERRAEAHAGGVGGARVGPPRGVQLALLRRGLGCAAREVVGLVQGRRENGSRRSSPRSAKRRRPSWRGSGRRGWTRTGGRPRSSAGWPGTSVARSGA